MVIMNLYQIVKLAGYLKHDYKHDYNLFQLHYRFLHHEHCLFLPNAIQTSCFFYEVYSLMKSIIKKNLYLCEYWKMP